MSKTGNALNDPKLTLEQLLSTLQALKTYIWGWNFCPFCYMTTAFRFLRYKVVRKSEMHQMTPNWTWTLNSQNYPVYTKGLPQGPTFWSVLLYDQRFRRYCTFYNSPLTPMLNTQKKNKQICQKWKIWIVTILYTTLVEIIPRSMHEFLGVDMLCTYRGDTGWSFFLP